MSEEYIDIINPPYLSINGNIICSLDDFKKYAIDLQTENEKLKQEKRELEDKEDKLREYVNRNTKENKELMEKYKEKINKLNKYDLTELLELSNQEAFHKAWYMCSERVLQILNEGDKQ